MVTAYVINLDDRPERWEMMQRDWRGYLNMIRVPAVKHANGHIGCGLSHIKAIKEAKARGDEYVLVLEDDCIPNPELGIKKVMELWSEWFDTLKQNTDKWDIAVTASTIIRYGLYIYPALFTENLKVFQPGEGQSAHWVLYKKSCYDKLIALEDTVDLHIDLDIYKNNIVVLCKPFLTFQRASWSSIENRLVDAIGDFKRTEELITNSYS